MIKRVWTRRFIGNTLLLLGGGLLIVNGIGLFHFTQVENGFSPLISPEPQTVSVAEFWQQAVRSPDEDDLAYVTRVTKLVSDRFLYVSGAYMKPTFAENWMLWMRAQYMGRYEWYSNRQAVRAGGGLCSQHALVLNNLLEERNFESRIIKLSGHVANEVKIDGKWRVCDPDFNVVFDDSLDALEKMPELVYETYIKAGQTEKDARRWTDAMCSPEDNSTVENAYQYNPNKFIYEKVALWLVWILPVMMLLIGGSLRRKNVQQQSGRQ